MPSKHYVPSPSEIIDAMEGDYWLLSVRNSNMAYFLNVDEGEELDGFLSRRDDMAEADRSQFCVFVEMTGRRVRLAVWEIEALAQSTQAMRDAGGAQGAVLKARYLTD